MKPEECGVSSAPLPADAQVGSWIVFGNEQSGQLDKSNSRFRDGMLIITRCEARDRATAKALKPKPWYWPF